MPILEKPLLFDHVLTYKTRLPKDEWGDGILYLEDFMLNIEVYQSGPVFFSFQPEKSDSQEGEFTYYLPINNSVELNEQEEVQFFDQFAIESALVLRQANDEEDFQAAYKKIQEYAITNNIQLEDTYYCVLLDVYGEYMIDLYVPIKDADTA
ncbi:DUF5085 family protein [Bacillus sp. MUM 13]|uniref:DUF5085 family protein n=1 Tax=Bacillus sp. MUM 13 TaxID=1678001 RepID=UPI0008F57C71|nr:DUF5085 family protein [Bacillus sp. MUM 13]OIK13882.1 hypothetical protein BIV59_04230 [Bacillus sp. MUM 13]